MFTNTYLPHVGGVARSVSMFESDLIKLGHKLLVVAPTFPEEKPGREKGSRVLRVPAIQNFNGSDFSVSIPIPFIIDEEIDDFDPDVIHSHHPFLLGDAAMRVARRRQLPLVFTHHTLYEQYTHYVSTQSPTMKKFVIKITTAYANMCTHVVAPSKSIADLLKERGVKTPVTAIPTGVDCRAFENCDGPGFRKKFEIPEKARVVGHLGRLAPEKNLDFLAKAVAEFMKEDPEAWFLVVGDGPEKKRIKKIFADQGIEKRLVLAGKQTGTALADAYDAMDIFAFSSKSETQGMVVTEAMAAANPVVALDASGVREVVRDGYNGRLLASGASFSDFAKALAQCFKDEEKMGQFKKNALKTARDLDRMNCASRLSKLYQDVCSLPAGKKPKIDDDLLGYWEDLRKAVQVEWEMLYTKINAVVKSFDFLK
jgi:glycosyltransferase involved in cell wall biosynthesis